MTVSFKQFSTFLAASEGVQSQQQLDEIWDKIFAKKKEKEDEDDEDTKKSKSRVLTAKDAADARKKKEEERKKELQKRRDDAWARAQENAKSGARQSSRYDRDDYALHRGVKEGIIREGKQSYSEEGYWKDDAKEAGYKVKKLSGNLMDGDQTWGAFDGDKKMGEFTEKENGRGGWLIT